MIREEFMLNLIVIDSINVRPKKISSRRKKIQIEIYHLLLINIHVHGD